MFETLAQIIINKLGQAASVKAFFMVLCVCGCV